MIRGTTPILHFTLPFEVSELSEYWITISQRYENIKIDKTSADCTASGSEITLELTQEDTLKLIAGKPVHHGDRNCFGAALTVNDETAEIRFTDKRHRIAGTETIKLGRGV